MKRNEMNIEDFKAIYGSGYSFIYSLVNQPKEEREQVRFITSDTRVYSEIRIARNPDTILFLDDNGNRMQIDGIAYIRIHDKSASNIDFYFDVVCDIKQYGHRHIVFLASKK